MKKLKFILCVGILGVMTYGGITAYNHVTMTEQERLLLANVEALTSGETGAAKPYCHSGGIGATQCSIDAGITISGQGVTLGCGVTCSRGYACCSLRCTCEV